MNSDANNKKNDSTKFDPKEPLTEKEAASRRPKVLLFILIILIMTIIGVFGYMVSVAMKEDAIDQSVAAERMDEYSKRMQPETEGTAAVDVSSALQGSSTLLKKLNSGEPVSILIVGDVFGTGAGAQDGTNWTDLMAAELKESFGSDVTVNNLSMANGNNAYSAYVSLMNEAAGNRDAVYDGVIVSLGYYDAPFDFDLQYEGVLRSVKRCYASAEIIGLIESASVTATDGYSDETALYARNLLEHYDGIVANMGEAFAVSGQEYSTLTSDGILPNAEGQRIYADWIVKKIKEKLEVALSGEEAQGAESSQQALAASAPVNPDTELYDHYYYIEASDFYRADDVNYLINISKLAELSVENIGMLGIDYDYVNGKNTVQVVIDKNIFTGWEREYQGAVPERHIRIVNNNAAIYDELAVSFATKEQADAFHGIIITGNLNLHRSEEKYDKLPLPPETTAPETEPETEAETETAESVVETAAASDESKVSETKAEETKSSDKKKKNDEKKSSNASRPRETAAQQTAAPETVQETAASQAQETTSQQVVETAAASPETQSIEGAVISDPSDSANVSATSAAYSVQPGQGIDIDQWNAAGPNVG